MSIMNADFAASILTSMVKEAKEPTKVSKPNTPSDPLKDIVVPQNLVESIVKFDAKKKGIESKVEKVEEVLEESTESEEVEDTKTLNESKVQDIVTRLAALLSEAKEVLQEIGTTTGMLGVKETGPVKKANKVKKNSFIKKQAKPGDEENFTTKLAAGRNANNNKQSGSSPGAVEKWMGDIKGAKKAIIASKGKNKPKLP